MRPVTLISLRGFDRAALRFRQRGLCRDRRRRFDARTPDDRFALDALPTLQRQTLFVGGRNAVAGENFNAASLEYPPRVFTHLRREAGEQRRSGLDENDSHTAGPQVVRKTAERCERARRSRRPFRRR